MIEVVLLERVRRLGLMGDVVKVKDGFARNYLLPRNIALRATAENLKVFETRRAQLEADNLKLKKEAQSAATKMADFKLTMTRHAGDSGQLYGSVNARDVAEALLTQGYKVSRTQVDFPKHIKEVGLHRIQVHLHPEVTVEGMISVALTEEEALMQFEKGGRIEKEIEKTSRSNTASLEDEDLMMGE